MSASPGTSARAAARRELGAAALMPIAEAVALLPLGDEEARGWLYAEGLVLTLRGREVVVWGDVVDRVRVTGAPPPPSRPIARGATLPRARV